MKKLYLLLFVLAAGFTASATIHNVEIRNSGFSPTGFTASVGDTVRWTLIEGGHTTTSTTASVPAGASPWNSGVMTTAGQTFDYKITTDGVYGYQCALHPSMIAGFSVGSTGINAVPNIQASMYPNPFKDKLTIVHGDVDGVDVYNMVGAKVASAEANTAENKTVINLYELPSGVYFVSTMKNGAVVETRRIVKTR